MAAKNYGSVAYWDERYTKQGDVTFDWVEQYSVIKPIMDSHVTKQLFWKYLAEKERQRKMREAEEALKRLLAKAEAAEHGESEMVEGQFGSQKDGATASKPATVITNEISAANKTTTEMNMTIQENDSKPATANVEEEKKEQVANKTLSEFRMTSNMSGI